MSEMPCCRILKIRQTSDAKKPHTKICNKKGSKLKNRDDGWFQYIFVQDVELVEGGVVLFVQIMESFSKPRKLSL